VRGKGIDKEKIKVKRGKNAKEAKVKPKKMHED
jgi:hypothetical protein